MRRQFIKVLQDFCHLRSQESTGIEWWFSDYQSNVGRAGGFSNEHTIPYGRLPDVETVEDPPLDDEFFQRLGFR